MVQSATHSSSIGLCRTSWLGVVQQLIVDIHKLFHFISFPWQEAHNHLCVQMFRAGSCLASPSKAAPGCPSQVAPGCPSQAAPGFPTAQWNPTYQPQRFPPRMLLRISPHGPCQAGDFQTLLLSRVVPFPTFPMERDHPSAYQRHIHAYRRHHRRKITMMQKTATSPVWRTWQTNLKWTIIMTLGADQQDSSHGINLITPPCLPQLTPRGFRHQRPHGPSFRGVTPRDTLPPHPPLPRRYPQGVSHPRGVTSQLPPSLLPDKDCGHQIQQMCLTCRPFHSHSPSPPLNICADHHVSNPPPLCL